MRQKPHTPQIDSCLIQQISVTSFNALKSTSKTMITIFVQECNPVTPDLYNFFLSNLQFHKLKCSCGHSACLSVHGYYYRYLKTPLGKQRFRICRVKCKVCGKTHAILLSSFVPYSQVALKDHVQIIEAFEDVVSTASVLACNDSIDESTLRYIVRQYRRHWSQRLLSEGLSLTDLSNLVSGCFRHYRRQFMQIRRTVNIFFSYTT